MTTYILTENDIIEILHNDLLKDRPYLIRFYNYDGEKYEIRMNEEDIKFFIELLEQLGRTNG